MKFYLYDTVIVLNDYLKEGVLRGELGAVVDIYTHPHEAYEVEFVDERGKTKALIVLQPNELCKYME
jgi:hypothetical protein